ncbi:MAG: GspH/FimT family pseudopilin [Acidiferrobacterales bacterium]|nr:GspH/FimT family pseudopilin [Gammaproteobacteria bacterium]
MRSSESPCKTNAGFTFLDLMITVAITGILTAIAIPSYWNYVIDTRLAGDAQFLAESLHLARIEAVTRDVPVSLCPSTNGVSCTSSAWEAGWIIFSDEDTPGTVDGIDEILRAKGSYEGTTTITVANGGGNYVQFEPNLIQFVRCEGCGESQLSANALDYATASEWAGRTLLRAVGIQDAMAKTGNGGNNGNNGSNGNGNDSNENGGYQADCSDQNSSNNPNSEKECNGSGSLLHLATFTLCDSTHIGRPGRAMRVMRTGMTTVERVRCDQRTRRAASPDN